MVQPFRFEASSTSCFSVRACSGVNREFSTKWSRRALSAPLKTLCKKDWLSAFTKSCLSTAALNPVTESGCFLATTAPFSTKRESIVRTVFKAQPVEDCRSLNTSVAVLVLGDAFHSTSMTVHSVGEISGGSIGMDEIITTVVRGVNYKCSEFAIAFGKARRDSVPKKTPVILSEMEGV